MSYQHPSGSQKRQKKKELEMKYKETLRNVAKISSFFHKEPSTSVAGSQPDNNNNNNNNKYLMLFTTKGN